MDLPGLRRKRGELAGDPVVEARADGDHRVAAVHGEIGLVGSVHAEHAEELRIGAGVGTEAHQGQRHRIAGHPHEFGEELARPHARVDDAAAAIEDRPLRLGHHLDRPLDPRPVGIGFRLIGAVGDVVGRHVRAGGELHVLRQIDQHRAGAAAARHVEGFVDGAGERIGALHQVVVLGHRPGDAGGVALLEGIVADQMRRHLPAEDDQRHRVHQRIGNPGHRVGGAGTGGNDDDADLAGRSRIALRRVHRAALLADEDVADGVLLK